MYNRRRENDSIGHLLAQPTAEFNHAISHAITSSRIRDQNVRRWLFRILGDQMNAWNNVEYSRRYIETVIEAELHRNGEQNNFLILRGREFYFNGTGNESLAIELKHFENLLLRFTAQYYKEVIRNRRRAVPLNTSTIDRRLRHISTLSFQ